MNILTTAAGAMVGGIWRVGAIVLAVVSLAACAYLGHGWYVAAHDRDQAVTDLKAEREISAQYQTAIREQSNAVEALAAQKRKRLAARRTGPADRSGKRQAIRQRP